MNGLEELRPGDIMFGPMGGFFPGVIPVAVGQLLLADKKGREGWRRWWNVRHVGVVVEAGRPNPPYPDGLGNFAPRLVEAMPGGAREVGLDFRRWTSEFVYVRPPYADVTTHFGQSERVAAAARRYLRTPYSYLDYVALAARAAGLEYPSLNRYITSTGHMICSQLADQALADAGYHVFDDGRLPQDVTPSELFMKLIDTPGTRFLIPGRELGWLDA